MSGSYIARAGGRVEAGRFLRANFLGEQDPYNIKNIREASEQLGFRLVTFNITKSTMPTAEFMARRSLGPAVVLADHQTAGIGREDTKKWYDIPGSSILFSGLVHLDENVVTEFADIAALKVCLALRRHGADVKIKAPNDIVLASNGRKVSGILVKNIYDAENGYVDTNIGIGVNVHYTDSQLQGYPTDYGATSLDTATGSYNDRQKVFLDILEGISTAAPEATALVRGHNESVSRTQNDLWRANSYLLGKEVIVEDTKKNLKGKVVDTSIGEGITIVTNYGQEIPVEIFDTDTKVRVILQ